MSGDFNLQACKRTVQRFFAATLTGVQNMREIFLYSYTVITVQAQVSQRADNSYAMDKSLSSYSNY